MDTSTTETRHEAADRSTPRSCPTMTAPIVDAAIAVDRPRTHQRDATAVPVDPATLHEYRRDPRWAITETGVVCLECGRAFRHLTNTHLRAHGLTSDEYKRRFGYNVRRALMIAPVRQTHADNAGRLELARRIRRRAIVDDIEFRRKGGRHRHTLEEFLTRRDRPRRRLVVPSVRDGRGRFTTGRVVRSDRAVPVPVPQTTRTGSPGRGITRI
jgi:predicted transcriptional regulator